MKNFINFLPPWVETNIQPAFYDKESGTCLQQTARMYAKVNQLVRHFNDLSKETKETVAEYIAKFVELKDFVDTYFENLDVQEEINNKLDSMAEDGTLTEIISQFLGLGALAVFDNEADMIASEHLIKGSKVQTLGKTTKNDGYGAYYTIDETGDIALANGLYATLVPDFGGNNYYDEITTSSGRVYASDYYVATIPLNDNDGNMIPLSINEDTTETTTPLTYAEANYTTLTTNCGLTRQNTNNHWKQGAIISNGVALHGDLCDIEAPSYMSYICFKADRSVINMPASATTDVMLAQGVTNAWLTFGQMITNGVITLPEEWGDLDTAFEPRFSVGVKLDGTIVIVGNDGRTKHDKGMSLRQNADLMLSLGCVNAWRCDGGGSTSIIYKGSKQNRNIGGNGTEDRTIYVTLNFKKETIDKELAKVYSAIGKERQLLNKQIRTDCDATYSTKKEQLFLFNWSGGYNVTSNYETSIRLQHQDALVYRKDTQFSGIKNESNRTIGFTAHQKGIYKVEFCIGISGAVVDGNRQLRIESPTEGTLLNNYRSIFNAYIKGSSNSDIHEIVGTIIFNNNFEDTDYYLAVRGQAGDDFARSYTSISYIGTAS